MQIDDRLATVLRQRAGGEATARIQYRQLLDLLGTMPSEAQGPSLDAACLRLGELSTSIPAPVRAAMLREPGLRLRNPRLIVFLCEQDHESAAAAIGAAQLDEEQWLDLVPALPVAARAQLRQRSDLGARAGQLLARLGILDRGLPPAESAAAAETEPVTASRRESPPSASGQGIGAIVRRIEDFRKARKPVDGEARYADSPRLPLGDGAADRFALPVRAFDFATDARGTIDWSDPGVAPMAIGLNLASPGGLSAASLAPSIRQRLPIRAARIELAGAPAIAGSWLIDAAPRFDPAAGGFTGYCGRMRRLSAGDPGPQASPGLAEADRMRQLLHELRTPVNAIQGFAEVIQQQMFGPTPHEYRALAASIASDAAHMLAGFAELERLARLEGGAMDLEGGGCDFAQVLAATDAQLKPFTASRDSGFASDLGPDPLWVALAAEEAEHLSWRLLATLAGAAHPGESLHLAAVREGGEVLVRLQLPTSLKACEGDDFMKATAGPASQAVSAGMFGTGFALRLAKAEAQAAGGRLERRGEELHLALPGLTGDASSHSHGGASGSIPV